MGEVVFMLQLFGESEGFVRSTCLLLDFQLDLKHLDLKHVVIRDHFRCDPEWFLLKNLSCAILLCTFIE